MEPVEILGSDFDTAWGLVVVLREQHGINLPDELIPILAEFRACGRHGYVPAARTPTPEAER